MATRDALFRHGKADFQRVFLLNTLLNTPTFVLVYTARKLI